VDRQPDRASLIGDRTRDGLPDPPGGVRRELVAHPVVELLHRPDEPEVPLLNEVEEGDARVHVVARDRHDEPQVRLDELALGGLVALVLPPRQLALLGRRQQGPVADLTDVELERILRRGRFLDFLRLFVLLRLLCFLRFRGVGGLGDELELRLVG
jgi:hypothetical protein